MMDELHERSLRELSIEEGDVGRWPALIRDLDAALTAEREAHEETRRALESCRGANEHWSEAEKEDVTINARLRSEIASLREALRLADEVSDLLDDFLDAITTYEKDADGVTWAGFSPTNATPIIEAMEAYDAARKALGE